VFWPTPVWDSPNPITTEPDTVQNATIMCSLTAIIYIKIVFGRGRAPDLAGGAHDATQNPNLMGRPPHTRPLGAFIILFSAPKMFYLTT